MSDRPGTMRCDFCAHRCAITAGSRGLCGVREHHDGRLVTTVYGHVVAAAIDPIEKKPLYHFLPGSEIFSVALGGCNFRCRFCQNASIAVPELIPEPRYRWGPKEAAGAWRRSKTPAIAWTYSEPTVWQDYLLDVSAIVRRDGARVVVVSNGFMTPETLDRMIPLVDAFNIDLKGNEEFYRTLCRARSGPVLDSIGRIAGERHLEVTTMLIESRHTVDGVLRLRDELVAAGVQVWHITRFFPAWRMREEAATSEEWLCEIIERLRRDAEPPFIFAGNSRQSKYGKTLCPSCGTLCIDHRSPVRDETDAGACPGCGRAVYGVFR